MLILRASWRNDLAAARNGVNHSFGATGITAYLKNGGTLEKAAAMANHASTRTTQLYDRPRNEVSLDELRLLKRRCGRVCGPILGVSAQGCLRDS
jgi:hypothetical protein